MKAPETTKECYELTKVYDFYKVMGWLDSKYNVDTHDLMFEIISHSDQEGKNDSLHRVYRHWLSNHFKPDKKLQSLFDTICAEFDIPLDINKYNGENETRIVFWVSW